MRRTAEQRRQAVYQYIVRYWEENGFSPSTRDICQAVGIPSTSTASQDIHALIQEGRLTMAEGLYRSFRPVESVPTQKNAVDKRNHREKNTAIFQRSDIYQIPIYGPVAAGSPIYADDHTDESISLPASFFPNDGAEYFILEVHGDSMINAGIFDGDHVIVRRQNTARNGEQVVALIEDSATIKTLYQHTDHIELRPENPAYQPIRVRECAILGVVCGLYRLY